MPQALSDELGLGASPADIAKHFVACRRELELTAVLTMTAAAEAKIRLDATLRINVSTDDLAKRLKVLRAGVRLPWAMPLYEGGILEAWKIHVASLESMSDLDRARCLTAIGCYKNLLDMRHWVAHGRYWRPKWSAEKFAPVRVADTIRDLYNAFRKIATHSGLMSFA